MGTFLKYVFYLALIVVIYLVGKGIYDGQINEQTTVGEVTEQVENGAADMAEKTKDAVVDKLNDYQKAPKKEITVGE
ncbi:MAG: hypothetical protein J6A33_06920 [Alphaproteobacteria bacterium]|nr:hypothetical protein [Alphaproteobacteria bacterium]